MLRSLWSRLILHFWVVALEEDLSKHGTNGQFKPDPIAYLDKAYTKTIEATARPNDWQGTTTTSGAQLHYKTSGSGDIAPQLYVTNLGDCQVLIIRPKGSEVIFKTTEQWHWFDCPRQLGTNSPDTPRQNAKLDVVDIQVGDIVLAMTDGVIDNLWGHEIVENVTASIKRWEAGNGGKSKGNRTGGANGRMAFVAEQLVAAARTIALDPFAESPFMEHAIEEGLASEGGKLDDISVVAALCVKNED